jgi:hypothetical protein
MLLKDYLIAIVLVILTIFAITGSIYALNNEYNSEENLNISVLDRMNSLNNIQENTESLYNVIKTGSITPGGISGAIFSGIGAFFQIVLNMAILPFEWIVLTAAEFGIPIVIASAIIIIITIAITFAIISAILRKNV